MDCLLHGLLSVKPLPPEQRASWAALFDHYVIRSNGDEVAHIPERRRGVLAVLSPAAARRLKDVLIARLRS
jgi:hypothetical protein